MTYSLEIKSSPNLFTMIKRKERKKKKNRYKSTLPLNTTDENKAYFVFLRLKLYVPLVTDLNTALDGNKTTVFF